MNTEATEKVSEMSDEELAESYVQAVDAFNGFIHTIREHHQVLNRFEDEVSVSEEQKEKINRQIEETEQQKDEVDKMLDELKDEVSKRGIDPYELLR